jgi:hypothetical protein
MNIPGFTAEASLYNTSVDFRQREGSLAQLNLLQAVSPQMGLYGFDTFGLLRVPRCPPGSVLICIHGHCFCD